MSADYLFAAKVVSPVKCNEKPWDLWVSEIGHLSPRKDDDAFTVPAAVDGKGAAAARRSDARPYKQGERHARYRRAGLNRLKYEAMSLHGLFPQMDNLNAAVCHMCGAVVKCSAAYRHLLESHTGVETLLPPPPPATSLRSRSRHKKDPPPPMPVDMLPVKMETSPIHTAATPLSRIVQLPQPDLQYMEEASTSAAVTGEVQVHVETGELPVVSIQDTEDLHLGENITDDIFEIMNSEGIQSADDITNTADWKNIIRDIGSMQDINFPQTTDPVPTQELYSSLNATLPTYTLTDSDLSALQFPAHASPMLPVMVDTTVLNTQPVKPTPPAAPSTPSTKSSRSKTTKPKFNLREYDPNKHCGVVTAENPKPCTRSLTCKAHALSLRRTVEGRSKPFDTLLAEHRASRDANAAAAAAAAAAPVPPSVPVTPVAVPPLLVNTPIDFGPYNGLTAEQQVNDIYTRLLSVEDPNSALPDTSSITSLLSQPPGSDPFLIIEEPLPVIDKVVDDRPEEPAPAAPPEICWYSASPRPLALCTFNASHAGGAVTLGKRFATVRSNIKSSLSRSQCKATNSGNSYYASNSLALSKSVHMNTSKASKPEVRKLIVTYGMRETYSDSASRGVHAALNELFGGETRLNGHVSELKHKRPAPLLDLGFALDPLLADEKC